MKNSPLLSVIIPVYNSETFLRKCLDSILHQTYPNIELILIDDGSTDDSVNICLDYTHQYTNIRVVQSSNGGASKSRNIGLRLAKGDYITFVDSDDFLQPDIYTAAINAFDESVDIVSFGTRTIQPSVTVMYEDHERESTYIGQGIILNIVLNLKTAVWNKIFRRSIIKDCLFPEEYTRNEDMAFLCLLINKDTILKTISPVGYNYVCLIYT